MCIWGNYFVKVISLCQTYIYYCVCTYFSMIPIFDGIRIDASMFIHDYTHMFDNNEL